MEKALLTLAESGSKSGTIVLYIAIAIAILLAGYFLLRKKK
jgi:LPXTG-motif cell wall-anchored protein